MELTENEIIQKYAKRCGHCNRNTLLPFEYEFTFNEFFFNKNIKSYSRYTNKEQHLQNDLTEQYVFTKDHSF